MSKTRRHSATPSSEMKKTLIDQLKEIAQHWANYFRGYVSESTEIEIDSEKREILGDALANLDKAERNRARRETDYAADKFEAILLNILLDSAQSQRPFQNREYIRYSDCKKIIYQESRYFINVRWDYRPSKILAEALARASLETGIDLETKAFWLLPFKDSTKFSNRNSVEPSNFPIMLNLAMQNYERCDLLLKMITAEREVAKTQYQTEHSQNADVSSVLSVGTLLFVSIAAYGLYRSVGKRWANAAIHFFKPHDDTNQSTAFNDKVKNADDILVIKNR